MGAVNEMLSECVLEYEYHLKEQLYKSVSLVQYPPEVEHGV